VALCLIIEDDAAQRSVLRGVLTGAGHQVAEVASGRAGLRACREQHPELAFLDLGLPDTDGLELLPRLLEASPLTRVIVLTGRDSVAAAVAALRAGARHYLVKPWELDELLLVVEREARSVDLVESRSRQAGSERFWGSSPAMLGIRDDLSKLAGSPWTPVLIEGPTGSGKEVVARELHRLTATRGSFVALNCAAVPRELQESELFGHEAAAFTGALRRRRGVVELAREGTLFLDEIGEMPDSLQPKLLRYLEERTFRRVGGEEQLEARSRVVAATHRNLEERLADGSFRDDLFFRLAVVRLRVPSLAERREDLLPLAHFLLRELASTLGRPPRPLSPAAEEAILRHGWPGNVRELRNRLERALVLGGEERIEPRDLDLVPDGETVVRLAASEPDVSVLRRVLREEGWVVARAARRLGVPRHWLRYRMKRYGLRRPD
jgi:DNA-binding NtrC family response regulator